MQIDNLVHKAGESMYHISIYFDTKTEARMREYIKKVAEVTGNNYMLQAAVPPHITLAAFECEKEEELVRGLECLLKTPGKKQVAVENTLKSDNNGMYAGTLQWVSVGSFLPGVIFLQPVLNEYLQGLAQQVYDCLKDVKGVKIRPCYKPFSWLPHSTVAKKLTPRQLQQAFEVLQQEFGVFEGKVVRIGLAKMNPHREIASWKLDNAMSVNKKGSRGLKGRVC